MAGVFVIFRLLYQRICSNGNRLLKQIWFTIVLRFHLTWFDQSNFNFLRSNYKFALNIHAEVPNKKLTCIHKETVQSVVFLNKRREQCQAESSFHLAKVKCSTYFSYIIIVILVWSFGYSKCSETNVYVKEERMNCNEQRLYQEFTSGDSHICLYRYSIFGQPQSLLL